jgi:hypothetical protein
VWWDLVRDAGWDLVRDAGWDLVRDQRMVFWANRPNWFAGQGAFG